MLTGHTTLYNQTVNYDLTLYNSHLSRASLTAPFTGATGAFLDIRLSGYGYSRKTRLKGGFWEAVVNLSTHPPDGIEPVEADKLIEIFYSKLGLHLEESVIGVGNSSTWVGYLHEAYLSTANSQMVTTYDNLANKLIVVDGSCNVLDTVQNDESILQYGVVEKLVDVSKLSDTGLNISTYLNTQLRNTAWVNPEYVGRIAPTQVLTLQLRFRGYMFTSGFKYFINSYVDTPASTVLADVVNNSDYLTVNDVETNNLLITNDYCENGFKALLDLVEGGSLTNPIWGLEVTPEKGVNFRAVDTTTPKYFINLNGTWVDKVGNDIGISPRLVTPAVIEDTFYPVPINEPNSIYPKANIYLANQVGVRANGTLEWSTEDFYEELTHLHILTEAKEAYNNNLPDSFIGLNGKPEDFIGA